MPVDIAVPQPTLHRFLQLETQVEALLLRRSILSEQERKRKNKELQSRLRAKLGAHPLEAKGWTFTRIVDEKTKASVFTEDEFAAWLAPSRELAAIEQVLEVALVKFKGFCSQLLIADVFSGKKRKPFSEWFAEKLCQRRSSADDDGEYLIHRERVLKYLSKTEDQQRARAVKRDPRTLGKRWRLPPTRPPDRSPKRSYTYDVLWALWEGPDGPPRSVSIEKIVEAANDRRSQDDRERDQGGITATTVRRLLSGVKGD
jgi:hypothetical protein